MTNDNLLPFSFPAIRAKKVTAAFDGGRLTSDGGVMLLAMAERRLGVADRLARSFPDRRDPTRILHTRADMIRARIHAIACGYEDADDLDFLRTDPAFKLACGRLPETGGDLCSQPTLSRMENAPSLKDAIRLTYALVDQWMASYERAPASVILDIDDTCDVAHGHQQLSLFNAHYDERCFLPIHVYDTERSRPVAVVLRPGKTPGGVEVRAHLRRLVRHIRKCWPKTRITFRGDGHYARPEAMTWCENNGADYVFGLPGTQPLSKKVDDKADEVRVERALENKDIVRGYAETRHRAGSWTCERRAVARIEATPLGLDIRFVVTNLECGSPEWIYDSLYCARGQAENLIKLQDAALIGSHVLPFRRRQPGSARPAHLRLLADADRPRRHSQTVRSGQGRVRDLAPSSAQNRRSRHRNRQSRAPGLRGLSSRGGTLRQLARRARPARPLTDGASAPSPVPFLQRVIKKCEPSSGEKPERRPATKITANQNLGKAPLPVNRSG